MENVDELKRQLKQLYDERKKIEEEVKDCVDRVQALGVGLNGPLVDQEVCFGVCMWCVQ